MNGLTAHMKVWLTCKGKPVFGHGKLKLLLSIERLGTLQAAARECGISYRKAWNDLRSAEKGFGFFLLVRSRGGSAGGAMVLTPQARVVVKAYRAFDTAMHKACIKHSNVFSVLQKRHTKKEKAHA